MSIKTIPLTQLTAHPAQTLTECADNGLPVVVELPDHRLVALQPLPVDAEDSLIDDLIENNTAFQDLLAKSAASPRRPFLAATQPE
jgi:hypothetical protein